MPETSSKSSGVGNNDGLSTLVVDNDLVTGRIHKMLLDNHGVKTQVAKNGEEAVALHRSGARFDIVLMDNEMHVKDGVHATRELREMGLKGMIIVVTSHGGQSVVVDEFMAAGLDDCLTKPLTAGMVLRLINQLITKA